jgi:hypothetical protein
LLPSSRTTGENNIINTNEREPRLFTSTEKKGVPNNTQKLWSHLINWAGGVPLVSQVLVNLVLGEKETTGMQGFPETVTSFEAPDKVHVAIHSHTATHTVGCL